MSDENDPYYRDAAEQREAINRILDCTKYWPSTREHRVFKGLLAEVTRLRAELAARTAERDALAAEVAALKAQADPINDAVNQARDELPDQWQVVVYLERNAGWVELVHPNFHQEDVHEDEASVSDLVREAIRRAKEVAR